MLQQDEPDDFVIATGEQYSVREFVELGGAELGMDIEWQGSGVDEIGIDKRSGKQIVAVDPRYFRPTEVETLLGDPTKAKQKLGWEPKITFDAAGARDGGRRSTRRPSAMRWSRTPATRPSTTTSNERRNEQGLRRRPPRPGRFGAVCRRLRR